jgi:hypothetical protein
LSWVETAGEADTCPLPDFPCKNIGPYGLGAAGILKRREIVMVHYPPAAGLRDVGLLLWRGSFLESAVVLEVSNVLISFCVLQWTSIYLCAYLSITLRWVSYLCNCCS